MTRVVATCLAFGLASVCISQVGLAADGEEVAAARARLQADFAGVQLYEEAGRVARVYGQPFGFGNSPEDTAEQFRLDYAQVLGVSAQDLSPVGPLADGRHTQPVMYDPETGEYKFTLVYYTQHSDGIPVFRSDLRLLVRNEAGFPLVLAASSLKDLGDFVPNVGVARLRADLAQAAALEEHPDLTDFTEPQTVIWAGVDDMVVEPVLAVTFVGENAFPEKWLFVADAATGEILYTEDLIIFENVVGNVSGMATPGPKAMQCTASVLMPFPYAQASISGGNSAYADVNGDYVIPNGGTADVTVVSEIRGQYFVVYNYSGAEEQLSQVVTPPGPADFIHNQADTVEHVRAQANGYVNANEVRDWTLVQNPAYPVVSTQTNFPVWVNRTDGYCPGNAWYDGSSINFCSASGNNANTSFASVSQHEYGHHLVEMGGSGQGQYGEGMGDCVSLLIADDPKLGVGFYISDCNNGIRNAANNMQYPCSGEIHTCGQLISGCVWSTRNELIVTEPVDYLSILSNLTLNSILLHGGSSITPAITTDFLTLDDDDGDLGNGTPHSVEILAGFGVHNMIPQPPPANDACADAIEACPGTVYSGSTVSATNDGSASCATSTNSPDVWYVYTPLTSSSATFSMCSGTTYDAAMSIHTGCPGTTTNQVGCDDDFCASGGAAQVTISVTAGTPYLIRVTGWDGSVGNYNLTITGPDCDPGIPDPLTISFPSGLPDGLPPGVANTLTVQIEDGTESYVPGSGLLHYRYDGGTYLTAGLAPLGGNLYEATFPAAACGDAPEYYISADGNLGSTVLSPQDAPGSVYSAVVGTIATVIDDDFETDQGWSAVNLGATSGDWQRGVPVDDPGWDYDPISDSDGSGQCYLTQNQTGNTDVDGGAVRLISPTLDMSGGNITISYDYFLRLTDTAGGVDRLLVEIDANDGAGPWTEIARHDTDGGLSWRSHTISQADLDSAGVTLTSTMKLRFDTNDANPQSINESGLDAFLVTSFECVDSATCSDGILNQGEDRIDCGGPCPPCECTADAGCDNGVYCDGIETCDAWGVCQPGGAPCGLGRWCDENADTCRDTCVAQAARSCRDHDTAGRLCIDMGTTGGVEPRIGGITELDLDLDDAAGFAGGVTVNCVNAGDVSGQVSGTAVNGRTVTVTLSQAIPDQDACIVKLDCGGEACVTGLEGDVDGNGTTATTDAGIIKPHFGEAAGNTTARYDVDTNGTIATTDFGVVKPRFGQAAPACP